MKNIRQIIAIFALALAASGCAGWSEEDRWGFNFNTAYGNQDAVILSLLLNSKHYTLDRIGSRDEMGEPVPYHGESFSGRPERPLTMDITWRNESTKKIYSEHVDFSNILPRSIDNTNISFVIQNNKIYIFLAYLAVPVERSEYLPGWMDFHDKKNLQIFPDPALDLLSFAVPAKQK